MSCRRLLGHKHSPDRVSHVADRSIETRRPQPPRRARPVHLPIACRSMVGFTPSGGLATPISVTRPNRVQLLAARFFASRGFAPRITPTHARLATCQMGNLHGRLLSARKTCPASPGAPDQHRLKTESVWAG